MVVVNCDISVGDIVVVWGCGLVGQFVICSVWMLGVGCVIVIDCVFEWFVLVEMQFQVEVINFEKDDFYQCLMEMI